MGLGEYSRRNALLWGILWGVRVNKYKSVDAFLQAESACEEDLNRKKKAKFRLFAMEITQLQSRVAPVDAERLPVCRRHKKLTRCRQSQKIHRVEESPIGTRLPAGKETLTTTSRG